MHETAFTVHKSYAEAEARARKVAFYLGVSVHVQGGGDCYTVGPDSPLVPGYVGPNPFEVESPRAKR